MRSIVKNFRDLPYHVVVVSLCKDEEDEAKRRHIVLDVPGSIASKIPAYFDEFFYLHVDKDGTRSLITRGTDTFIAKDRSGKLDAKEPADLGLILDKILKGGER
jgi:hypothetical protein